MPQQAHGTGPVTGVGKEELDMHNNKYAMKVGDVVSLNLGGPRMKISHVYEPGDYHAGKVEAHWIDVMAGRPQECFEVMDPKALHVDEPGG